MQYIRAWTSRAGALALLSLSGSCVAPLAAGAVAVTESSALPANLVLDGDARQGGMMIGRAPDDLATLTLDNSAIPVADDGTFLIAFDRDAADSADLVATLTNGQQVERHIIVAPGQWRIEHVNAARTGGATTSAEFQRRRPAELAQINAARQARAPSDGWRQSFRWPVTGRSSGVFGAQRIYRGEPGSYHSGSDIAVPAGTPFVAPAAGVVTLATSSPFTLEGYLIIIDHGMGLNSAFLHCSRIDVRVGDRVEQGQVLGAVGESGRATGPHLHWSMKWRDARIDPSKIAGPMTP